MERAYIAIDMKSFYASVECVARGLDPLQALLLVADESRSDQTICLAVSPALKAIGVPSRPRLFEARQAIRNYEAKHRTKVDYMIARPRMAEYERVSAQIYAVILKYASQDDVHVYSIDESFIDATPYLHLYTAAAFSASDGLQEKHPAHIMAMTIIRDILAKTGITATVGIGTNLYLAKVAMDIVAKKMPADKDGVRIAELNEDSYKILLWEHQPLTDFWMIGPGKARRLMKADLYTMGDVAIMAQYNEEWFYKTFGIDGEIIIDHAFGIEPVTMQDIKNYRSRGHSLSNGQVLPRPYQYSEARNVLREMIDTLCADMFLKGLIGTEFYWWVGYDYKSLETGLSYDGPLSVDFYGRIHPKGNGNTVRMRVRTNSVKEVTSALLESFDSGVDRRLLFRRLGVCANNIADGTAGIQLDMFTDYAAQEKERKIQAAMGEIRRRFGPNSIFKGNNLIAGATQLERNSQIGGHRA